MPDESGRPTCFIAMPITTPEEWLHHYGQNPHHFTHLLDHVIIPAVEDAGMAAIPPKMRGAEWIHSDIVSQLEKADLVLVDLSTFNPNVLFEFGVRVALNKPACPIIDDKTQLRRVFDTAILNTHHYDSRLAIHIAKAEQEKLTQHIKDTIGRGLSGNALWTSASFSIQASVSTPPGTPDEKLDALISMVSTLQQVTAQAVAQPPPPAAASPKSRGDIFVERLKTVARDLGRVWGLEVLSVDMLKPTAVRAVVAPEADEKVAADFATALSAALGPRISAHVVRRVNSLE